MSWLEKGTVSQAWQYSGLEDEEDMRGGICKGLLTQENKENVEDEHFLRCIRLA